MSPRNTRVSRHPRSGTRGVRAHDREINVPTVPHGNTSMTKTQQTRLKRLHKNRRKANQREEAIAIDIMNVAINDRDFYKARVQPYIASMVRKKEKGQLNKDLALLGWTNHTKYAIEAYNKQLKIERPQVTPIMYPPTVKAKIAEELNDHYYPDIKRGNYD